jgi:Zn-dependent alcohol dehydrogenase
LQSFYLEGRLPLEKKLITKRYPLDAINEALDDLSITASEDR